MIEMKIAINIQTADKDIDLQLTEIEARQLYNKLKDLFGGEQVYIPYTPITYPNYPYQPWSIPPIGDGDPPPQYPVITYTYNSSIPPQGFKPANLGETGSSAGTSESSELRQNSHT